ncbi:hypothetical protein ACMFMF_007903 [Clarireedia jacksonii]
MGQLEQHVLDRRSVVESKIVKLLGSFSPGGLALFYHENEKDSASQISETDFTPCIFAIVVDLLNAVDLIVVSADL